MGWGTIKIDQADRLFSIWIRLRDGACKRCYSPVRYNANDLPVSHENSHFKGRGREATRFEPMNCDTMCAGCHSYLGSNPYEHLQWHIATKGQKMVDKIVLLSNTYKKKDRKLEAMYWRQQLKKDYPQLKGY
jgi:hypothetical protein